MAEKPKNNPEPQKNLTPSERKHAVFERSLFLNSVFSAPEQTEGSDPLMKKILFDQERPKVDAKIEYVFGENWKESLSFSCKYSSDIWDLFNQEDIYEEDVTEFYTTLTEIGFELRNWDNINLFSWEIKQWINRQDFFASLSEEQIVDSQDAYDKIIHYLKAATAVWGLYIEKIKNNIAQDVPKVSDDQVSAFLDIINELNFDVPMLSSGLEVKLDPSILEFIESLDLSALPDKSDSNPLDDL